jgi:hypothetical protein
MIKMTRFDGLFILDCPKVDWVDKKNKIFNIATVFGNMSLIYFSAVPKSSFKYIEESMEIILEHETIGLLLDSIEEGTHKKFDSLFPNIDDMKRLKRKNGKPKKTL